MRRLAIEAQRFEFAVRGDQQRAAGRFVRAARLDAHQAIFDQLHAAHAVRRRDFIQLFDQRDRAERFLPFTETGVPASNPISTVVGLIGRFRRRNDPLPHRFFRRVRGIFEHAAFMAQVPDVAVAAVNILLGLLDGNIVRAARKRWRLRAN